MKRLIIVTGSSRGIGRSIALEINRAFNSDSSFLLLARDLESLESVKGQMVIDSKAKNQIHLVQIDFSAQYEMSDYFSILKNTLTSSQVEKFNEVIAIYNHGTLEFGSVSLIAQENLRQKFETNLFSIWSLLSALNLFIPYSLVPKQTHVNISSGYANEPVANWSGHCCARSARDMLFKCFALEQPGFKILNYEPGIVYTDMLKQACQFSNDYKDGYTSGRFNMPEDTARKLVEIIRENAFLSGSKIKFN
ncbi:sepiapterin reductase [Brachionus plicatilis]|uniref:Sepiapterin reductase n=1 Tax=Brachionus plicatilis TaxID=10195 RepID=A0A3M7SS69_BRAPC|nr:sepiapterin reductase [Brachionus plicatilis]